MADDKLDKISNIINGDKGSINQEYGVASAGLNLDNTVNQVPNGKLTYALNAAIENFDSSSINYQNEQGNEFCVSFPEDYVLIGEYFISEKEKHVFFLVNPKTNESQIGYMQNNDCVYHTLLALPCLNFNIHYPIHKVAHKISNCKTEIYWTDAFNSRRYLDIENAIAITNCNELNIQPDFNVPQLSITDITTGGSVTAGTYQFAIQYSDAASNPYTSFYSVTNPTPIADIQVTTTNFDYTVGKSIVVGISNLDTTGEFQYYNVAVIKTVNSITSVELIGTYFIESSTDTVTYTGQIVDNIRLSIADIFEKYPYYDVANDVTAVQDVLVWSGLTSSARINYQSIASQITLQWETWQIPFNENYADEINATNLRSYLRDEVYAFEIVFLLKNGMQTDGFHIPGRVANNVDKDHIYVTDPDFIGEPLPGTDYNYRWKIYNTANVIGTDPNYSSDPSYKGKYQHGQFAYWESTEQYPGNVNIWGSLANQPIRHHKFPDVLVSPISSPREFKGISNMTMGNNPIFPIGVKIDVNQVNTLIASSSLTTEQKNSIVGYKIVRGDRSTNKSIVAKGILRNVGKYTRENQDYYYPNYPYNDLGSDPFLNATNNAWKDETEPFIINVLKLPSTDAQGNYLEVTYNDPNTNKQAKERYRTTGEKTLCSIGKPTITSIGLTNAISYQDDGSSILIIDPNCIGTVSYANYKVYDVSVGFKSWCSFCRCAGWEAQWNDPILGVTSQWVANAEHYHVRTIGGPPVRIRGSENRTSTCNEIHYLNNSVNTSCKSETPQPSISSFTDISYRQIFNSPETSFGQPFLGDVLKLENVMFGKGIAHFVEVKNNAKYKLLTEEAQQDALTSSAFLGRLTSPFSASAMFSAYQAYLTIYINGITRKNYAYSYNSIADYNYAMGIPNGLGVKQRSLDVKKYLIPGVESTGVNDFPINNYQRESSIFLKTKTDKTPIPFPSNSPYMMSGGTSLVTDKSRYIISDIGNCSNPAKENNINVVSYYASLKNTFVNQWGQMYSYKTIDTGFQHIINDPSSTSTSVFGGDTFISRFAFKTKLPFFIDNRVGAPDDSDIFYDEIGNIAYPKYWHSARSILKDYTIANADGDVPAVMSNMISYKAHNFDCPNSQLPEKNNPNRTYYDGYFYLFAYGVPNFYCETSYNLDLRQAYNNREGDFWPHVSNNIPDDWVQEKFVPIAQDNTYYYNTTYSKQNKENNFTHLPPDWESKLCYTIYPFRAVYSDSQEVDADNKVNNWLSYGATSYFDFPQNYGQLTSLDGIQNKAILARFENKSLLYNNLLTMDTSNPQAAYLGNPNMFKNPPIDFAETDLGYVGSQNKMLLKIPQGQITIDAKRGQVFLIQGTQVEDLSALGSGMNRFFTDHLAFEILRYFPEVNTDNHFNGVGLHGVYDSKFDRVIITKLDYIPLSNNIIYDSTAKEFYIQENNVRTQIYLTDEEYFCNKSWTLSYHMNAKAWISFHSYIPNFYIGENNFFYSGKNGCCVDFDFVAGPLIPSPPTTTTTTTTHVLDCNLQGVASVQNCNLNGTAIIIVPTTTTTTSTSTSSTTTTTTTASPDCFSVNATTASETELPIVYVDCNYVEQTINVGGTSGTSVDFCASDILSYDSGQITLNISGICII